MQFVHHVQEALIQIMVQIGTHTVLLVLCTVPTSLLVLHHYIIVRSEYFIAFLLVIILTDIPAGTVVWSLTHLVTSSSVIIQPRIFHS